MFGCSGTEDAVSCVFLLLLNYHERDERLYERVEGLLDIEQKESEC